MKRLLVLLFLAGCASEAPTARLDDIARGLTLGADQIRVLQSASAACPGLGEYAPDLRVTSVDADVVVFEVNESPSKVPDDLKAWGQRCEIVVGAESSTTTKRACASLCRRSPYAEDGPPYKLN